MILPRPAISRLHADRRGLTALEISLTICVIVGLLFVSLRILTLPSPPPPPPAPAPMAESQAEPGTKTP